MDRPTGPAKDTTKSLSVLFASSEAQPLIKTGGLADVAGSLPVALRALGHDVRLIVPAYPRAVERAGPLEVAATLNLPGSREPVHILAGRLPGTQVPVYLVDAYEHFHRGGNPYTDLSGRDWGDNPERFTLFCRVIVRIAMDDAGLEWRPRLVHCNDWQTGLTPALLSGIPDRPSTVFTIHNLAYQGVFDRATFRRLGLPSELWAPEGLEFHDHFSFIKGGIAFSDHVNTVSPTYAREVRTPDFGYGLEGLLSHLGHRFSGILNGIDYHEWDPASDRHIAAHYDAGRFDRKWLNKPALQAELGLPPAADVLLFGYIGRLVAQKGVDLILGILPDLLAARPGIQVVMQGAGAAQLEAALEEAQRTWPDRVAVHIGYDEALAHRIEAACDCFLMPSRFEPCGLNQLYSLRYGTVPIVHKVGGLADTVVEVSPDNLNDGSATGFVFEHADRDGLQYAVLQALELRQQSLEGWRRLATTGMAQDFSWDASAWHYVAMYQAALTNRLSHPLRT